MFAGRDQPCRRKRRAWPQQLPKGAAGKNLIGGGGANKGGTTQADYSQQLIDVIQGTIAPGSWDVNGGNGSIKFFPGLNVMIIRNTAENQEDLVDVLERVAKELVPRPIQGGTAALSSVCFQNVYIDGPFLTK